MQGLIRALLLCLYVSSLATVAVSHDASFLPKLYRVFPQPKPTPLHKAMSQNQGEDDVTEGRSIFQVRQVPGDGGCMFHALATCLHFAETKEHFTDFDPEIRKISTRLRQLAVKTLQSPSCSFVLQSQEQEAGKSSGTSIISSDKLLKLVAQQYNTTAEGYCTSMLQSQTWGGGPELMALAHSLETPIHVYELQTKPYFPLKFYLKRTAIFDHIILPSTAISSTVSATSTASTAAKKTSIESSTIQHIDKKYHSIKLTKPPLEILFTDGRFPHMYPWSKEQIEGNHFLALFPVKSRASAVSSTGKVWKPISAKLKKVTKLITQRNSFASLFKQKQTD